MMIRLRNTKETINKKLFVTTLKTISSSLQTDLRLHYNPTNSVKDDIKQINKIIKIVNG